MSQRVPDYSNTIIYKLCCKDPSITDIYIGHTTNFRKRKSSHKSSCNNETDKIYNLYVYKFIRDHGGFDNWDMIEICKVECLDKREAERNERNHIESLGASLNKIIPTRTKTEWFIDNEDRVKEVSKVWRDTHPEIIKANDIRYRNTEKCKEYRKNYRETHKDVIKEYHLKRRDEKGDILREYSNNYYQMNKDKILEQSRERYYKKKAEKLALSP